MPVPPRGIRKRAATFEKGWATRFGLVISARDPTSKRVSVVTCRFCLTFRREPSARFTKSNRCVCTVKTFKPPFRTDNFLSHLRDQHSIRWNTFDNSDEKGRLTFFEKYVPYAETITSHFGHQQQELSELINIQLVDQVLKPMLVDQGNVTASLGPYIKFDFSEQCYRLCIKNRRLFNIVINQVSLGLSFRGTCQSLLAVKSTCSLSFLGTVSEKLISHYVQALTMSSIQKLSDILKDIRCWAFAIAFDGATNRGSSYLDVRVRFCIGLQICNYHLLAIPMSESHTGLNMFTAISTLMSAVVGDCWTNKLIGVTTDGAANMVGRHSSTVSRIQTVSLPGFFRVWCGAHQLDLVVQEVLSLSLKDTFYDTLTKLIAYLRRQHGLRARMKTTCPTVASTRWLSLGGVCKWLVRNRVHVTEYLTDNRASSAPSLSWWVFLYAVHNVMSSVDICFKAIQGRDTLVSEQNNRIKELASRVKLIGSIEGPLTGIELLSIAADGLVVTKSSEYCVTRAGILNFVQECGSVVETQFHMLESSVQRELMDDIGKMLLGMFEGVSKLCALRNAANAADGTGRPPALPSELLHVSTKDFFNMVAAQRQRLLVTKDLQYVEDLEQEFVEFMREFIADASTSITGISASAAGGCVFEKAWSSVGERFARLREFCGGLATVFPGTATVESDFSVINREANPGRSALGDLALEGILHAKQWDCLRRLYHV